MVLLGQLIGFGRFPVGTEQDFGVFQLGKFFVIDGYQPQLFQSFAFLSVVYNISQAIECFTLCQFFFCFPDGGSHSETES